MSDTNTNGSILDSIKKLLGINADTLVFDQEIIIHINSVFSELTQMGIGPTNGFAIDSSEILWSDFLMEDTPLLNNVKTYVYLKVRLLFDPPTTAPLIEAINQQIKEIGWRMYVQKGGY